MDALLERLPAVFAVLVVAVALLPAPRFRALGAGGAVLIGLAAAAGRVAGPEAGGSFTTINELLALAGAVVAAAAIARGLGAHGARQDAPTRGAPSLSPPAASLDPLLFGGLLIATFAPHIIGLGLGVALTLAWAARQALLARRPAWLFPLASVAVGLGVALWWMLTILGPLGGAVGRLADGPFSLAAERLLTLLVGGSALTLAGLPPLHRAPWRSSLSMCSVILLFRLVLPAFPEGVLSWQAPALLLLVFSLAWSAYRGWWAAVATAGGLLALSTGAGAVGCALAGWGWLAACAADYQARRGVRMGARWLGLMTVPPALLGFRALEAGLRVQVVLSVAAVAALLAGVLLRWKRGAGAVKAPLY